MKASCPACGQTDIESGVGLGVNRCGACGLHFTPDMQAGVAPLLGGAREAHESGQHLSALLLATLGLRAAVTLLNRRQLLDESTAFMRWLRDQEAYEAKWEQYRAKVPVLLERTRPFENQVLLLSAFHAVEPGELQSLLHTFDEETLHDHPDAYYRAPFFDVCRSPSDEAHLAQVIRHAGSHLVDPQLYDKIELLRQAARRARTADERPLADPSGLLPGWTSPAGASAEAAQTALRWVRESIDFLTRRQGGMLGAV